MLLISLAGFRKSLLTINILWRSLFWKNNNQKASANSRKLLFVQIENKLRKLLYIKKMMKHNSVLPSVFCDQFFQLLCRYRSVVMDVVWNGSPIKIITGRLIVVLSANFNCPSFGPNYGFWTVFTTVSPSLSPLHSVCVCREDQRANHYLWINNRVHWQSWRYFFSKWT